MKLRNNPLTWMILAVSVLIAITYFQPSAEMPSAAPPICGDGSCSGGSENCLTCAKDCGTCPKAAFPAFTTPSFDITSFASDTLTNVTVAFKEGTNFEGLKARIERVENPSVRSAVIGNEEALRYFSFELSNIEISYVEEVSFVFALSKDALSSANLDPEKVTMRRFTTTWESLQTSKIGEDSGNYYYQSISKGASLFAITAGRKIEAPSPAPALSVCGDDVCAADETKEGCCQDCGCERGYSCMLNKFYQSQNVYECVKSQGMDRAVLWFIWIDLVIALAIIFVASGMMNSQKRIIRQIRRMMDETLDYIRAGDYGGAVESYRDMKEKFDAVADKLPKREKKKMYIECMSIYDKISALGSKKESSLFI